MDYLENQLLEFKQRLEVKIREQGKKGKTAIIRSSSLINLIHDAVKNELIQAGIDPNQIHPKLGKSSRELEIAGFLKRKRQDVCVTPDNSKVPKAEREIDWGPLAYKKLKDKFGQTYTENTLVINVRSQLSSLAKNSDTLFERTFAEAENLHMQYPKMILGDVYLIPAYEYNEAVMDHADHAKRIEFKTQHTDVARYISFFNAINNRNDPSDYTCKYERCALLIIDFRQDPPFVYKTCKQLKDDGLLPSDFPIPLESLSFDNFAHDILDEYEKRFNIMNLKHI